MILDFREFSIDLLILPDFQFREIVKWKWYQNY